MDRLSFYNKPSILIFSVLLTGFGGALIFGYNLRAAGKNRIVVPLVIISLIANAILRQLVKAVLPGIWYELFIPGALCGLILIFPIWGQYLSDHPAYKTKSILIPIIVAILLYGV